MKPPRAGLKRARKTRKQPKPAAGGGVAPLCHEAKASETDQHRFEVEGSLALHVSQAFY
jgi:hypothetical protein